MLPADLDGTTQPTTNTPEYFVVHYSGTFQSLYTYLVDWTTPANSSFSHYAYITTASYTSPCTSCVPQPGTTQVLDTLSNHDMFRAAYRILPTYDSLVFPFTVNVGNNVTGVRWYEIRNLSTTPSLYQQGTYSPDTDYRWMASMAMDYSGDIAVGYSVSSSAIKPGISYTGRQPADAAAGSHGMRIQEAAQA